MHSFDIEGIASEIKAAQDHVASLQPITSRFPEFDLATAYATARCVHERRISEGWLPLGRKVGFTNPEMWTLLGVREPIWGHIYNNTVKECPDGFAECNLKAFLQPRIEPEIIVHFRDAPSPALTKTRDILGCIDWIAHGIEIVQSHFPAWTFQLPDTVADGGLHGALFIGKHVSLERFGAELPEKLEGFSVDLSCGDVLRERGFGKNVLGSPLIAVKTLIRILKKHGNPGIQAGDVVTTGTLTKAYPIYPAETWRTHLQDIELPGVTISFC